MRYNRIVRSEQGYPKGKRTTDKVVMVLFTDSERRLVSTIAKLTYCNPFLPPRIEYEREALGEAFVGEEAVWSVHANDDMERQNIAALYHQANGLAETAR